ncbi:MAG: hypothetical protein P1R74_09260 [Sedimenticola sp.]|nr:hypothetical protein [Sedimenticola sp.]
MNKYQPLIPPNLPFGYVATVLTPDLLKADPLGDTKNGQQAGWENDAGHLATLNASISVSSVVRGDTLEIALIVTPTETSHKVINVLPAVIGYRPGDTSNSSRAYVCPKCNGPVKRLRRRFIDRLVSLIIPVRRYHCRAIGWDCDWKGNLRVYSDTPH